MYKPKRIDIRRGAEHVNKKIIRKCGDIYLEKRNYIEEMLY